MMGLPLAFAQPLVLVGLLSLPVLWWLLRLIPPRPRRIAFPPTRLLFDLAPKEETPARTPWWLTLLRLMLAALVIIAAAGPLWNPPIATSQANVPMVLLIDDGWSAASTWDARMRTAEDLLARADADNRAVALVPLSEPRDISLETSAAARVRLRQVKPKPHTIARSDALPGLTRFLTAAPDAEVLWLSDGTDAGGAGEFVEGLAHAVDQHSLTVVAGGLPGAHALAAADNAAGVLSVKVLRSDLNSGDSGFVRALGMTGLQRSPFAPNVAPIAETLAGYEGSSWLGLFLPAGTPAEIVQQLRADWIKASALPEIQKGLAAAANSPLAMSSDDFVQLIQSEAGRWREIATRAKIVLD